MSVPADNTTIDLPRFARQQEQEIPCCRCGDALEPDIIYGGLRYYVCRPCGQWAVPHPPIGYRPA